MHLLRQIRSSFVEEIFSRREKISRSHGAEQDNKFYIFHYNVRDNSRKLHLGNKVLKFIPCHAGQPLALALRLALELP